MLDEVTARPTIVPDEANDSPQRYCDRWVSAAKIIRMHYVLFGRAKHMHFARDARDHSQYGLKQDHVFNAHASAIRDESLAISRLWNLL